MLAFDSSVWVGDAYLNTLRALVILAWALTYWQYRRWRRRAEARQAEYRRRLEGLGEETRAIRDRQHTAAHLLREMAQHYRFDLNDPIPRRLLNVVGQRPTDTQSSQSSSS
jgi:hypothetical protein